METVKTYNSLPVVMVFEVTHVDGTVIEYRATGFHQGDHELKFVLSGAGNGYGYEAVQVPLANVRSWRQL